MKKIFIILATAIAFLSPFGGAGGGLSAQNIGINTDGSIPETGVMLDIKNPTAKATTAAVQTVFQLKSFDANTDAIKLRLGFKTDATATNRYGFIDFPDFTGGTPTYRNFALQPLGGNVGIGTTAPAAQLHTTGTVRFANFPSGVNGAIVRTNSTGDLSITNFSGIATDVLLGNGTFGTVPATIRWDQILAPTAGLTLAHGANATAFNFNSVTTANAFALSSSSLTSGTILNLSSSAAAFTGTLGSVTLSGSAATNTGTVFKVTNSGALNTGTAAMVTNLGTGLSFRVNDATGDADATPFVVDAAGSVGIGTTAPASLLHVNGTARLGLASTTTGTLIFNQSASANSITIQPQAGALGASYTLTLPPDDGAAGQVLNTNGSGVLTWVTPASSSSGSGYMVLLYNSEADVSGNAATSGVKSYVVPANTYSQIMAEAEVAISKAPVVGGWSHTFNLQYAGVTTESCTIAPAVSVNDVGGTFPGMVKYSAAMPAGGTIQINAPSVGGGNLWYVKSLRVYGIY